MSEPEDLCGVDPLSCLGPRIKQARELRKMTREDLAKLSHIQHWKLKNVETEGMTHLISLSMLRNLSRVLNVQIGFLMGEHGYIEKGKKT